MRIIGSVSRAWWLWLPPLRLLSLNPSSLGEGEKKKTTALGRENAKSLEIRQISVQTGYRKFGGQNDSHGGSGP
jgi:hypothetical protein